MEFDLKKTLEWCEANNVVFGLSIVDGLLSITGRKGNIFAEYAIDTECTPEAVGQAVYAALFSVQQGSKFHAEFGHMPSISDPPDPSEVEASKGGHVVPELPASAPRGIQVSPES